jgi:hypothetical protein
LIAPTFMVSLAALPALSAVEGSRACPERRRRIEGSVAEGSKGALAKTGSPQGVSKGAA